MVTNATKHDFTKTKGYHLLQKFSRVINDSFTLPNVGNNEGSGNNLPSGGLPVDFQDQVRHCRTLARLNDLCDTRDEIESKHKKAKITKAANIENYRKQLESNGFFENQDYDETNGFDYTAQTDDSQLYKNEMAFVGAMISKGIIDADDLKE